MNKTSIALAILLLLVFAPPAATQTQDAYEVRIRDATGGIPPTNATLIFSKLDGSDPEHFETNPQGTALVDAAAGTYRVRVFVRNETGELWLDQEMDVDPADAPLTLSRNLPSVGRRPEIVGGEAAPDGSAVYVPIGTNVDLRIAIRYPGPTNRTVLARATLVSGNTTIHDGPIGITTLNGAGWINGTLAASSTNPYHANESLTTLRVSLLQNGTTTLFDMADPITVIFRDGCIGAAVQMRATVEGTSVPFCAPADHAAYWQSWAVSANALANARSAWYPVFEANKTTWSYSTFEENWDAYLADTASLRANVTTVLDAAQTDTQGVPTWQQLEILRGIVDRNHTAIERIRDAFLETEAEQHRSAAYAARAQTFGLTLLVALVAAAATFGGMTLIVRAWKRRAEYWIGYSGRDQESSPLWITFAVSAGIAVVGLLLTLLSPLWRTFGGGP